MAGRCMRGLLVSMTDWLTNYMCTSISFFSLSVEAGQVAIAAHDLHELNLHVLHVAHHVFSHHVLQKLKIDKEQRNADW